MIHLISKYFYRFMMDSCYMVKIYCRKNIQWSDIVEIHLYCLYKYLLLTMPLLNSRSFVWDFISIDRHILSNTTMILSRYRLMTVTPKKLSRSRSADVTTSWRHWLDYFNVFIVEKINATEKKKSIRHPEYFNASFLPNKVNNCWYK